MITPIGHADVRSGFVRRTVISSLLAVALTGACAVIAMAMFGDHGDVVLRAAFATAGLLVALSVLNNFTVYVFGARDNLRRARPQSGRFESWPGELLEIEGRVSMAGVSAFDYQSRLRPVLSEITRQRLESNRNIDIERQPDQARSILGDDLWEMLVPIPLQRDLRDRPGPTTAAIARAVERIESI